MLKSNRWRPIAGTLFLLLLASAGLFLYRVVKLDILVTEYLVILFAIVAIVMYLSVLMMYYGMKDRRSLLRGVRRIVGMLLALIMTLGCGYGAMVVGKMDETVSAVTESDNADAVVGVYVRSDDAAQSLSETQGYVFGVLGGNEQANTDYSVQKLSTELEADVLTTSYSSVTELADALNYGAVKAIVVNEAYLGLLDDMESYRHFSSELRQVDEIHVFSEDLSLLERINEKRKEIQQQIAEEMEYEQLDTDAFILYLSGSDGRGAMLDSGRSDVNILMAVNPKSKQILLINTPRDTYVPNPILGGAMDKLTHCGISGITNSIAALESFYGVSVDNYVQINFSGFTQLIDAIGGITVDNPKYFVSSRDSGGVETFPEGENYLDGYKALIYARERHAFGDGDLARGRNQMRVIQGIVTQVTHNSGDVLKNYAQILDGMQGMFATDLTSARISELVKLVQRDMTGWDVKSYNIIGTGGMTTTASAPGQQLYVMYPDASMVAHASDLVRMLQRGEILTDEDVK